MTSPRHVDIGDIYYEHGTPLCYLSPFYNNPAASAEGSGGVKHGGEAPAAKRKFTAHVPPSLGTINEDILSHVLLPCLDPVGDLKNI